MFPSEPGSVDPSAWEHEIVPQLFVKHQLQCSTALLRSGRHAGTAPCLELPHNGGALARLRALLHTQLVDHTRHPEPVFASAAPNVPKYRDFARNTLQDRRVSFFASLPLLPLQSLSFPPRYASRTRVQSCWAAALRLMSFTACVSSREATATCTQLNAIRQGSAAGVNQARELSRR